MGYPSDLTDAEWAILEPLLPGRASTGRRRVLELRVVLNAIFYVLRGGGAWRSLPSDFPPWTGVYYHFARWRDLEVWEALNAALRERVRLAAGREATPSAAIVDSQSVKTGRQGGERGYDAGKKVNGRKRHLLVDTQGLLLKAKVHAASVQDRDGVKLLLEPLAEGRPFPRLGLVWADGGYNGSARSWLEQTLGWRLELVQHRWGWVRAEDAAARAAPKGFSVLPRRWVVERTFAWLGQFRRLSKDFERLCETSEALIYAAMARLMLRRLAQL